MGTWRSMQISPGKSAIFLLTYPPNLLNQPFGDLGLYLVWQTHPTSLASNWIHVLRVEHLPPSSFRFRLTTDTLDLGYGRRSPAPVRDSHPRDSAHAGRTKKDEL